ncbi:50S ribosomal protein L11 methyltransferase [Conexibacter sp. SYSU D00693]|uniref:50S ribosomal protein L11 methyltransferase n=1 Tax=Conexibacter sp. SYSU D00693 TaxID=2812560 RepID=UPI00196ADEB7|nr:50S ribosomal protein L11 methyltransferase [Conexibacter sp. SYSU D00693]
MIRLAVRVRREHAELVLAELLELAPSGVEEAELEGGVVEYAVYGPPGEVPDLPDLQVAAGDALVEVETTEVADDWADRWRQFHKPVVVGGRLHVRPPWCTPREDLLEVVVDPGQAFGTGAHGTTRLCLELLCELAAEGAGGPASDLGCGSGVLAIAAAKLGLGPVLGVDHERESVTATAENAQANGVDDLVRAERFDLLRGGPAPGAPLVLANLLRPLLLAVARAGFQDAQPRVLVASGLLVHEADEVAGAFAQRHGLHERRRLDDGEWAALLLARPAG